MSSVPPPQAEYGADEISALVLDPGYSVTRAGFAGEDTPKSVVPTHYGLTDPSDPNSLIFGDNAIHTPKPNLEIRNPYGKDGLVEDWDTAAKLWQYSITSRLIGPRQTSPSKNGLNDAEKNGDVDMEDAQDQSKPLEEFPLMMTEPGWNPPKSRAKMMEIAIEEWGAPAFWLGRSGVLAAFASAKPSALVIDIGASTTSVTPVYDGLVLKKGITKSPFASNFISSQLRLLFSQNGVPLTPHYLITAKTPVDAGQPSQATYRDFPTPPHDSFRRLQEERVLTEFKESVVKVWSPPNNNGTNLQGSIDFLKQQHDTPKPFEFPDGWNNVFGVERFKAVEGMFDHTAAISDPENPTPTSSQTLPALMQQALGAVDVDIRAALLNNVVVTGGGSLVPGMTDRINYELQTLYPTPRVRLQAPGNVAERKYAAWVGGSILGSLGSFHQMWISKREWEEHGSGIIEKRCK
ncbi:MAG: NuA4 histone acetyltransferase subunit [Chrysothrix sp. TS-e1954]|nr:MAG: NuA4 histone acetyltransferase subunit [Chrysothrix sp. TS-e1954]